VPGASDSSYGVQVARMAGLPPGVTDRATALLRDRSLGLTVDARVASPAMSKDETVDGRVAESQSDYPQLEPVAARLAPPARYKDNGLLAFVSSDSSDESTAEETAVGIPKLARELVMALASVNVAATTPIEAINLLFSLQQRALAALKAEPSRIRLERE
jgi:DNA mismatch repair protein MutS